MSLYNNELCVDLRFNEEFENWCQVFAAFIPDDARNEKADYVYRIQRDIFYNELQKHFDKIVLCNKTDDITNASKTRRCVGIFAVEGGAVLCGDLSRIEMLAKDNVKILTLCWNGENELGYGQNEDKGLKLLGKQAVLELEKNNIIIDVSHLSDRGFYDVLEIATKPFIATHSNSRTVCNVGRNLTDDQLLSIKAVGGIVGINFFKAFLSDKDAGLYDIIKHIDYMLSLGLENNISIGTDFDGADICSGINRVCDVTALYDLIIRSGINENVADKIFYLNAFNFFVNHEKQ